MLVCVNQAAKAVKRRRDLSRSYSSSTRWKAGVATPTLERGRWGWFLCCGWLRPWLRCRGLRSWLARLCRTEFFKFGLGRKAFGKVFLIFRQTRTNQASVGERKTVSRHLFHSSLRSPALLGHAIGGDHHSGAVITYTAVNEDFLAWVFSDQGEKVRKNSILRK